MTNLSAECSSPVERLYVQCSQQEYPEQASLTEPAPHKQKKKQQQQQKRVIYKFV